jgi:hypothetical protein
VLIQQDHIDPALQRTMQERSGHPHPAEGHNLPDLMKPQAAIGMWPALACHGPVHQPAHQVHSLRIGYHLTETP